MGALIDLVKLDVVSIQDSCKTQSPTKSLREIGVALGLSPPRLDHSPDAGDNDTGTRQPRQAITATMNAKNPSNVRQNVPLTSVISYPPAST